MKLFIGFSGNESKQLASFLERFIQAIFETRVSPFFSDQINPAKRWGPELARALAECNVGVFCLTRSNWKNPWINFEAGAISKDTTASRPFFVCFDFEPGEVSGPLEAFMSIRYSQQGMVRLMREINKCLESGHAMDASALDERFAQYWDAFSADVDAVLGGDHSVQLWDRRYDIPSSLVILRHELIHHDEHQRPYIAMKHYEFSTTKALVDGDYTFRRNSLGVGSEKHIAGLRQMLPEAAVSEDLDSKDILVRLYGRNRDNQDIIPIFIANRKVYLENLLATAKQQKIEARRAAGDIPRWCLFRDHIAKDFEDFAGRRVYAPIHHFRLMIYFDIRLLPDPDTIRPIIIDSEGKKIQSSIARMRIKEPQGDEDSFLYIFEAENLPLNSGMWAYWKWPFGVENGEITFPSRGRADEQKA